MQKTLDSKIDRAISFLRTYSQYRNLTLAYSGGKDSDVCLRLCRLARVKVNPVYNNTTIDPPYTLSRNRKLGIEIRQPKYTFFELVQKKGLPSMFRRFCCFYLKEQYIGGTVVMGVRKAESIKRQKIYEEPSACRAFSKTKIQEQIYPILEWDDNDIREFVEQENLNLHPLYYDERGCFRVERRLGCIGCPLQGDRGKADFLAYPKMLRQWAKAYKTYVETHQSIEGVYEDIVWHLFYSNHGDERYRQTYHGFFESPNAKQFLSEYFNVKLD